MILSHVLLITAGALILVLANGAWIAICRDFWKWKSIGAFWLAVGVAVAANLGIAAALLMEFGK